jgi:uncharacterized membrane protein (DUF373 family)
MHAVITYTLTARGCYNNPMTTKQKNKKTENDCDDIVASAKNAGAKGGALIKKALVTDCRKRMMLDFYQSISNFIIDALIIAVLLVLLLGTVQIFLRFPAMIKEDFFTTVSHNMLNDIMVVFIFVELFRVLVDYFKEERVKITYIADATLVFIFKEIWIRFSEHSFDPLKVLAMSAAILAVAVVRTTAVRFSPVIKLENKESSESKEHHIQDV